MLFFSGKKSFPNASTIEVLGEPRGVSEKKSPSQTFGENFWPSFPNYLLIYYLQNYLHCLQQQIFSFLHVINVLPNLKILNKFLCVIDIFRQQQNWPILFAHFKLQHTPSIFLRNDTCLPSEVGENFYPLRRKRLAVCGGLGAKRE